MQGEDRKVPPEACAQVERTFLHSARVDPFCAWGLKRGYEKERFLLTDRSALEKVTLG